MRTVAAVIVGYIVIVIFVMVTFSVTWMLLGPSQAFKSGTVEVTTKWLAIAIPLSLIAAVLGGVTAATISRSGTGVKALALFVVVLGLIFAVINMTSTRPAPPKPISELATMEAASYAKAPMWYDFTIPFLGGLGVWIGGALKRSRR